MSDISRRRAGAAKPARFLLRLEAGLHGALRRAAVEAGVSLNDYLVRKLAAPVGGVTDPAGAAVLARAAAVAGERLAGVVAFGSWTRGDLADSSDVDVLVVVDRELRLSRALYARWDEQSVEWEGRPVEPHFVWLPAPGERVSGLWAEVAVDGVVLFERGLRVSAALVRIRRQILSGRLVRRLVHGQPYWSEVA